MHETGTGEQNKSPAEGEDEMRAKEQNALWVFPEEETESLAPLPIQDTLQFLEQENSFILSPANTQMEAQLLAEHQHFLQSPRISVQKPCIT